MVDLKLLQLYLNFPFPDFESIYICILGTRKGQ